MLDIRLIKNKRVLLRVGFDIPNINITSRIKSCIPTIKLLVSNGNSIILISKWNRPNGFNLKYSFELLLKIIQKELDKEIIPILNIAFINQFQSLDLLSQVNNCVSKIILLENLYFDPAEFSTIPETRLKVAEKYAVLADVFIDECFISSHRVDATNTEIKNLLPSSYGLNYEAEISSLGYFKENPKKPFILILGGAKLDTKIPLLQKMLPLVDKVILGGIICLPFLRALGNNDLRSSQSDVDIANNMLGNFQSKIILAEDFNPDIENPKDIGAVSLENFKKVLNNAGSVFWNGPLGQYEFSEFGKSTVALAKHLSEKKDTYVVVGGGDTIAAIPEEYLEKFAFISQGGGATLNFLSE